ncbi:MAG: polyprenyl synthetase family protein [Thermoplasmata archaeon]|nr:polyprenyl synthetase family protein [Thermoplasmata archaeon]
MDFKQVFGERIKAINRELELSISSIENDRLRDAMLHYPKAGGKRLRPIVTMLVADAISKSGNTAMPFGIALEMVHNFTLVHDDVMDQDETRRGLKTVHKAYGMPEAILAGDALFAKAFEIVGGMDIDGDRKSQLTSLLARAVILLAEGQQMDMDFEKLEKVASEQYMKMIERKTAVLYSAAAQGGAITAGAPEPLQEDMFEFGRLMGLAFQIWDDVLDLRADEKLLGKPVGSDIRNGKKTLIMIYAIETLEEKKVERLLQILGKKNAIDAEVNEAISLLDDAGAIDRAERIASEMIAKAKMLLDDLPGNEDRKLLKELTDFMIKRDM